MSHTTDMTKIIEHKNNALQRIEQLFDDLINSGDVSKQKKADILSFWIKTYSNMIEFEDRFDPVRNMAYKRGNVLKVNFGFNIGSEYGGSHYAVVLDNNNHRSSPVVTVIPLTSKPSTESNEQYRINLGTELYTLLKTKSTVKKEELSVLLNEVSKNMDALIKLKDLVETKDKDAFESLKGMIENAEVQFVNYKKQETILDNIKKEIDKMKRGSVAIPNQITTISKIRIDDPKKNADVLSGISLSESSMIKIDSKIKELYCFKNNI